MNLRRHFGLGLFLLAIGAAPADAGGGPLPPCAGRPFPAWTPPGSPPAVVLRHGGQRDGWRAAACSGLKAASEATVVAVAGSFRAKGGLAPVLRRIGAISKQRGILSWSARRQAWQPMLEDAAALAGPDAGLRRGDFAAADFRPGARLHAVYDDAEPLGPVIYETLVLAADDAGVDILTRNLTVARLMGFKVAGPGDIATHVALRRDADEVVRYFALTTVRLASMAAAMTSDAAHINRAVATFRYVAGIPTDAEPPGAAG